MGLTVTQLKQIIKEEISKVLQQEALTPEQRKTKKAEVDKLYDKYQDIEDLDLGNDIAKVEDDIKHAKGNAEKAPFKKKLAALKSKEETLAQRMKDAYAAYEKAKKQAKH
jgi:hypothetical protein